MKNIQFYMDLRFCAGELTAFIENLYEVSGDKRWTVSTLNIDSSSAELAKSLSKWIKLRSRKR